MAKPKLKKAEEALNKLNDDDINTLKVMFNMKPPETVVMVMEAICVIFKVKPDRITNPKNPKEKIDSYSECIKKQLNDKNFLYNLQNFEKNSLEEQDMQKVRQNYISKTADFNPTRV